MKHLLFLLLLIPQTSLAQSQKPIEPKIENVAWVSGTWHGEAFGGLTEEIWSEPSGGSMMATFKLIVDGNVKFYEIEVIREVENSLILQLKHFNNDLKGWETKDETVDFPLKEITKNKVVFEGMSFEKISDTEMNVYVDIKNDKGEINIEKFNYKKHVQNQKPIKQLIEVKHSQTEITIDGIADEIAWANATWQPMDQRWIGDVFTDDDFKGRYKLTWRADALYLLAEIQDDQLRDVYENPLERWWDEDCLEIFIDEDNSGGEHQFNNNAFAYHIDLHGNVVDVDHTQQGILYNSHVISDRKTNGNTTIWETKILLFDDTYMHHKTNTPLTLSAGKNVGFALAYCDNDNSDHRENFIGSIFVEGTDKDRGWIDANIFGTLVLTNKTE